MGATLSHSLGEGKPWTEKLWIYDLRTNKHFSLNEWSSCDTDWRSVSPKGQRRSADQNPLKRSDLDDLESPAVATHPIRDACWLGENSDKQKPGRHPVASPQPS